MLIRNLTDGNPRAKKMIAGITLGDMTETTQKFMKKFRENEQKSVKESKELVKHFEG